MLEFTPSFFSMESDGAPCFIAHAVADGALLGRDTSRIYGFQQSPAQNLINAVASRTEKCCNGAKCGRNYRSHRSGVIYELNRRKRDYGRIERYHENNGGREGSQPGKDARNHDQSRDYFNFVDSESPERCSFGKSVNYKKYCYSGTYDP